MRCNELYCILLESGYQSVTNVGNPNLKSFYLTGLFQNSKKVSRTAVTVFELFKRSHLGDGLFITYTRNIHSAYTAAAILCNTSVLYHF